MQKSAKKMHLPKCTHSDPTINRTTRMMRFNEFPGMFKACLFLKKNESTTDFDQNMTFFQKKLQKIGKKCEKIDLRKAISCSQRLPRSEKKCTHVH